jgi:hypothetical protein
MSPLLGHRPSLRITHKENGHNPPRGLSAGWWVLTPANAAETNGLTCLPKHGKARDSKFLVTHLMTDQRCLTSTIARRSALTVGPSSSSKHQPSKGNQYLKIHVLHLVTYSNMFPEAKKLSQDYTRNDLLPKRRNNFSLQHLAGKRYSTNLCGVEGVSKGEVHTAPIGLNCILSILNLYSKS